MTRSEIAHELELRGHPITSTDKAAYIGTILWRHRNRFSNIEGKGYWLKGIKVPETVDEKFRIRAGAGYME
jgi:hypothetical protein